MVYLGKSIEREMYYGAKPDLFRLVLNMRKNHTEVEPMETTKKIKERRVYF
jgi:hypothetical protein